MDLYAAIAAERRELATLLGSLTDEQWATPSLCSAWTVREVSAHLLLGPMTSLPRFAIAMARARGNFDRASEALTARLVRAHGDRLPELLREHAENRFSPPGMGPEAPLTDLVVHGQDIRRPLRFTRKIPTDRLRVALDLAVGPKADVIVPKGLLDGLRLEAIDLDWSHGSGAVVRGPGEALLLAITGRAAALDDLTGGQGLASLSARLV